MTAVETNPAMDALRMLCLPWHCCGLFGNPAGSRQFRRRRGRGIPTVVVVSLNQSVSSEVDTGSREENTTNQKAGARF
jgi:hypothetical protein